MTTIEKIQALRTKAKNDPVAKAVLTKWALRERARKEVRVNSLTQAMRNEGFEYQKREYADFLKYVGNLGLGKIERTGTGRLHRINDVEYTLQSIGQAALSDDPNVALELYKKRNHFKPLASDRVIKTPEVAPMKTPEAPTPAPYKAPEPPKTATLNVTVDGKPVRLNINPEEYSAEELINLINKLKGYL